MMLSILKVVLSLLFVMLCIILKPTALNFWLSGILLGISLPELLGGIIEMVTEKSKNHGGKDFGKD